MKIGEYRGLISQNQTKMFYWNLIDFIIFIEMWREIERKSMITDRFIKVLQVKNQCGIVKRKGSWSISCLKNQSSLYIIKPYVFPIIGALYFLMKLFHYICLKNLFLFEPLQLIF